MTVIVAPYLINCWTTFGDPLYAINYHAEYYVARDDHVVNAGPTASSYMVIKARSHVIETVDTVTLGLTSHPFLNKWRGFERWVQNLGVWLSWAALLGLLSFAGSQSGRLLLLVAATSLIPYAVTWQILSRVTRCARRRCRRATGGSA